jgi:hypothetical protein
MTSEVQVLANRQNALLSTGPRSAAGKAASSRNALKHGLRTVQTVLRDEDEANFREFVVLMLDDWQPIGIHEAQLVQQIAINMWRRNRVPGLEAEIFEGDSKRHGFHGRTRGDAWVSDSAGARAFDRLSRYEQRVNREGHRDLRDLMDLQAWRLGEERVNPRRTARVLSRVPKYDTQDAPRKTLPNEPNSPSP